MSTTHWKITENAEKGSFKLMGEVFGPQGKPRGPWGLDVPIVTHSSEEKDKNPKKIVVYLPGDRFGDLPEHRVVMEADGPDHNINRLYHLYLLIKALYCKPFSEKRAEHYCDKLWSWGKDCQPEPGTPLLYQRMAECMFDEGLMVVDDECTPTTCVLRLCCGS